MDKKKTLRCEKLNISERERERERERKRISRIEIYASLEIMMSFALVVNGGWTLTHSLLC